MKTFTPPPPRLFLILAVLISFTFNSKAQVCTPAVNADNNSLAPVYGTSITANDVLVNNCFSLKVWVSSYGLSWDYTNLSLCGLQSGSDKLDYILPGTSSIAQSVDVSIVNGDKVWANVVFYDDDTKQFYFYAYEGVEVSSAFVFTLNTSISTSISGVIDFTSTGIDPMIHIDANGTGMFSIVYNTPTGGLLQTLTGYTDNVNGPILNRLQDLDNSYEAIHCDVAIAESGSLTDANIYYAYSNYGDRVKISRDTYFDLANTVSANTILEEREPLTNYYFRLPRIACPGDANIDTDWSAVWESVLISTFYTVDVLGLTSYNATVYPGSGTNDFYNYTEGVGANGEIPYLATVANAKCVPVLSYDKPENINASGGTQAIQIAWYGEPDGYGRSVIGITTDVYGVVADNDCVFISACYEYGSDNPNDEQMYPSLAGRHGDRVNLCFVDNSLAEVLQKDFELCETFRPSNTIINIKQVTVKPELNIYPNPSNGTIRVKVNTMNDKIIGFLKITDAMGRLLFSVKGNIQTLEIVAANQLARMHNGLYIVGIDTDSTHLRKWVVRY